jgi:hypothetical protein
MAERDIELIIATTPDLKVAQVSDPTWMQPVQRRVPKPQAEDWCTSPGYPHAPPVLVPDGRLEAGTTEDHDAADGSEGLVRRSERRGGC